MPDHTNDKPLDFWAEEIRLFGVAHEGQYVDASLDERRKPSYEPAYVALDYADRMVGDLSLVYTPADAGMPKRFGFVAGLWDGRWRL
ncbi:MAG: hypothetical protein CME19_20330 [Gemmatimonadetes bacterium]|nr:hypothetical protein [Gemmatimonadota bacterium]